MARVGGYLLRLSPVVLWLALSAAVWNLRSMEQECDYAAKNAIEAHVHARNERRSTKPDDDIITVQGDLGMSIWCGRRDQAMDTLLLAMWLMPTLYAGLYWLTRQRPTSAIATTGN